MVSAANSNSGSVPATPGSRAPFSGSPVAHETPVIATGARTDESGKRELFKENTTTALVFPNGGVIRLAAPANPGQLLFLTHLQTRREVVAQVTRRRSNPGSGFYIELEFTEPAPDFWGIAFPEAPAPSNATASSAPETRSVAPLEPAALAPAAAEFLQPAEPGSDDLGPNAPAPSTEEVNALMEEVEALRAQLKSMQSQAANPGLPAMHLPSPPASETASAPPAQSGPTPDLGVMLSSLVASQAPPPSSPAENPQQAAPVAAPSADHPLSSTKRPVHEPDELDDALLPKPALDFTKSQAPASPARAPIAPRSDRTGLLRLALLAVVSLFAVMVAAWNMHLLPWLVPKSNAPAISATAQAAPKKPAVTRPAAAAKTDPSATPSAQSAGHAAEPANSGAPAQPANNPSGSAALPDTTDSPTTAADSHTSPKPESASLTSVAKRSAVRSATTDGSATSSSATGGADTVPPKLIKSVRAVAPGDALRQFMTGNVTLDALIDKTGQVKAMRVLSGPPSFHKAAMEALKRYRYEPARQNGKPVSAHLTVTIPFWFEP